MYDQVTRSAHCPSLSADPPSGTLIIVIGDFNTRLDQYDHCLYVSPTVHDGEVSASAEYKLLLVSQVSITRI